MCLFAVNLSSKATSKNWNIQQMMEASALASNAALVARTARLINDAAPDSFPYLPTFPFLLKCFVLPGGCRVVGLVALPAFTPFLPEGSFLSQRCCIAFFRQRCSSTTNTEVCNSRRLHSAVSCCFCPCVSDQLPACLSRRKDVLIACAAAAYALPLASSRPGASI